MKIKIRFSVTVRIRREGDAYGLIVRDQLLAPLAAPLHFPLDFGEAIQQTLGISEDEIPDDTGRRVASTFWVDTSFLPGLRTVFGNWAKHHDPIDEVQPVLAEYLGVQDSEMLGSTALTEPHRYIYDEPIQPLSEPLPELHMTIVRGLRMNIALRELFEEAERTGRASWTSGREIWTGRSLSGIKIDKSARYVLDRGF